MIDIGKGVARVSKTLISTLPIGLLMTLGACAEERAIDTEPNVGEPAAEQAHEALNGRVVRIHYRDTRTPSRVTAWLEGPDGMSSAYYWDSYSWGTTSTLNGKLTLVWNAQNGSDPLYGYSYTAGAERSIDVWDLTPSSYALFTNMKLAVKIYLNGACHYDYEMVNLANSADLYFNGNGGSWQDDCYKGNFLHY